MKYKPYEKITRWFAEQMRKKLLKRRNKRTWKYIPDKFLFKRLEEEVRELEAAMNSYEFGSDVDDCVVEEAVDVANFAMMIADNAIRHQKINKRFKTDLR